MSEKERLSLLSSVGQIGWWEVDYATWKFHCSDYLSRLLGLDECQVISFQKFEDCIHEDFRERIAHEFQSIPVLDTYDQTFPIYSSGDIVWIRSRLGHKYLNEQGHTIAYGVMQVTDAPACQYRSKTQQRLDSMLLCLYTISNSWHEFLSDNSQDAIISKVLKNVLDFFRAGRTYIIKYNTDYTSQSCTHEVVASNVEKEIDSLQGISTTNTPWWTKQILAGKPILLDSIDKLATGVSMAEHNILTGQNIKSIMVVPLRDIRGIWGYIGIDMVDEYYSWTSEDYRWFLSIANIIAVCIGLREAKEEIEREHAYLGNLYRYMPLGYIRINLLRNKDNIPFDFTIADANEYSSKLCGVSLEEYKGKRGSLVFQNEHQLEKMILLYNENKYIEGDKYYETTGKTCRYVVYSPEIDELVCLLIDITEILKTYNALERSEKMFYNVFSNIPLGIEIYDKDHKLIDLNNRDMEMFGVRDRKDVIGVNFCENPNVTLEVLHKLETEDSFDFSLNYSFERLGNYYDSKRNEQIYLYTKLNKIYDSQGNYLGFMLINVDNTERIVSMNRIRDFENFFSLISEYSKIGYMKLNILDYKGYAIKQWYKNMGESEDTPLSNIIGVYSKMHPEDRVHLIRFIEQARLGLTDGINYVVRILCPGTTDSYNWIRISAVITQYKPEDNLIELISVNYDITELKETEFKLIDAKEKAETADKLKSAFLANMSHEIRTPLNAIVGFSSLLAHAKDPKEREEYMRIVEKNNGLLVQLVSDILDLSKIESGIVELNYEEVDINLLCREVIESMQLNDNGEVQLLFEPTLSDCFIVSDRRCLRQIIYNFVTNAIKFTSKGFIRIGYEMADNAHLRIYVSDTGIGIKEEDRTRVFDRFIKLNNFVQGTGLGLPICKNLIEQLGGNIGVDSVLGEGSRFWIVLPFGEKS